jgi:hypothetical protein
MGWYTIAGGFIFPAIFFGFLTMGEELESRSSLPLILSPL